jgi:hypothetical protein
MRRSAAVWRSTLSDALFRLKGPTITPVHGNTRSSLSRAALAALVAGAIVLAWIDPHVIAVLPALMLPALLVIRRYPGERTVCALVNRSRRRLARPSAFIVPRACFVRTMPRGGLLLACSLAVRPPPAPARAMS